MFDTRKNRSLLIVASSVLLAVGCGAFEDNINFVCQGVTETVHLENGAVSSREMLNTRRFIAIKDRKVGDYECMFWNKGRIICQSSARSIQHMGESLAYQINIDRETGETNEHTETADMQRNFRGKCMRYKGPKL